MANSETPTKRVASTRPENRRGMTKSQIREERRLRSNARKKRRRTLYMIGGGALGAVFILALTIGSFGPFNNSASRDPLGLNEGGPVPLDVNDGNAHIVPGAAHAPYSYRPATSGPHWFNATTPAGVPAPARWGIYDRPLPDEVLVHNLEHGGIGFHYDCPDGCADTVQQLENLIPRNPSQYIMSPYSGINNGESKIAITAWRHHLYLDEVDVDRIREFIREYQDRAPESIPGNSF